MKEWTTFQIFGFSLFLTRIEKDNRINWEFGLRKERNI